MKYTQPNTVNIERLAPDIKKTELGNFFWELGGFEIRFSKGGENYSRMFNFPKALQDQVEAFLLTQPEFTGSTT